jgi:uncharacterized protein YndB with AHSA1/START domain
MASIRHRVGIAAPAAGVYEALATKEGLSGWWTRDVDGDPNCGGKLQFFFGRPEPSAVMEVVDLTPNEHVRWNCVEGPVEWVGTHLTFDLKPSESAGETVVVFAHADWREPVEFMHHCSTKWGQLLLGLKTWLEGGASSAYPKGMRISSWDG